MSKPFFATLLLFSCVLFARPLGAQECDGCGCSWPAYKLQCQTVYEERPVTAYRTVAETYQVERQITTLRPVWETSVRERRYRVEKPLVETSYREETYTVMRPVRETQYRDMSYNRVRYVAETQSRLERRVVQRPVVETSMREEHVVVQRPVTETVCQDQVSTTMAPVTTYRQQVVDNGQYADQVSYQPGPVRNRLRWQWPHTYVDPVTGLAAYQRAGFYWRPYERPGAYQVQRVYVPNPAVQQIAETSYVPQQVVQKVPVQVTRMVAETQTRQIPVQVTRMQLEEEYRQVPVTTQRPVVERVENMVPVEVCRWERQEMVRRVPVTTCRMTYEDRVEQIPVRTCKMVSEVRTVATPVTRYRLVAETTMRTVPRTVFVKVPVDPCTGATMSTELAPTPLELAPTTQSSYRVLDADEPTPAQQRPSLDQPLSPPAESDLTEPGIRPTLETSAGLSGADASQGDDSPLRLSPAA